MRLCKVLYVYEKTIINGLFIYENSSEVKCDKVLLTNLSEY